MITRRGLLAAGVTGGGALLVGCGPPEEPVARPADALARLLALKLGLIATYEAIDGRDARRILTSEREHVRRLRSAIATAGGSRRLARAVAAESTLEGALALERRAVAAWIEALPALGPPALRSLAAGQLTADAQHESDLLALLGRDPLPDAFADGRPV